MNDIELKELNDQLDAIRKDPLLILEASDEVKQAAANVKIHKDWINDPDVWETILARAEREYPLDADYYNIDYNQDYNTIIRQEELIGNAHVSIYEDIEHDPSVLLNRDAHILRSLPNELSEPSPKVDADNRYFRVPMAESERAKELGLEMDSVGVWKLPPTKQQNFRNSNYWDDPNRSFEKVFPQQSKQKALSSGNDNELRELNDQLDAIRKDPLLILHASKDVKMAAANVNIYNDWFKDEASWSVIEARSHEYSDAQEVRIEKENAGFRADLKARGFDDNTVDKLIERDRISLDDSYYESRQMEDFFADFQYEDPSILLNNLSREYLDRVSNFLARESEHHTKIDAANEYFRVPIAEAATAKRLNLTLDHPSQLWYRRPTQDIAYECPAEHHFDKVPAPQTKQKTVSSGIEM